MIETPSIPAENDASAPVSQTEVQGGMLSGAAFKAAAEPVEQQPDPHAHQRAMAHALRAPKPIIEETPSC